MVDNYEHSDINIDVMYTTQNIPTSEMEQEYYQQINCGCICEGECSEQTLCSCRIRSGALYIRDKTIKNIHDSYRICETDSAKPIYECNNMCKCYSKVCGNRLIQFGPRNNLKIINCSNNKGMGLTTTCAIKTGNFVCEYAGEILSETEANLRYANNEKTNKMNYIFSINEYFGEKRIKTFIDPSMFGNIGRYINHSCEPNCKVIPIRVNNIIPHLCIFAVKDIEENTELTFDYGDGSLGFEPLQSNRNKKECLCFSEKCRKYLPFCT